MNDKYLERISACWILAGVVVFVYGLYIGAVGETDIAPIMPIVQGAVLAALGIMGVRFARLDKMWAGVIVLGVINIVLDFAGIYFYLSYPTVVLSSLSAFFGIGGIAYLIACIMYYKLVYSKYWEKGENA